MQQKKKVTVLAAILPKEDRITEKEWIEGIKVCSKDMGFRVDFFFEENEESLKQRIEKEENGTVSSVLTKEDLNDQAEDKFVDGYEAAKKAAKQGRPVKNVKRDDELKIGIAFYNGQDPYIADLVEDLNHEFKLLEEEKDLRISIDIEDASGKQQTQDVQMEYLMEQDCDVILLNPVDIWSSSKMIHRAKEENIPLIFFNREPPDEDMKLWEKVYYVGSDGKNLGQLQGEILIEAFQNDREIVDKNQDGTLSYLLVEGEEGHSDSVRRTDAMYKTVTAELPMDKLGSIVADWDARKAKEAVEKLPYETLEECEAFLCNNDNMAFGVINALHEKKLDHLPIVLGINGSKKATDTVDEGHLYGTVLQNNEAQITKITELVYKLWNEKTIDEEQKIYIPGEKYRK